MKYLIKIAAISIALSVSLHVFADDKDWIEIGSDSEAEWSFKAGSGDYGTLDGKFQIARAIVKKLNKSTNQSYFVRYFIKTADCNAGAGTVYENDLEGKFISKYGYVQGGNTWGTEIGDTLCAFHNANKKKSSKKQTK